MTQKNLAMSLIKRLASLIMEHERVMSADDIICACLGTAAHLARANGKSTSDFNELCLTHWRAALEKVKPKISPLN